MNKMSLNGSHVNVADMQNLPLFVYTRGREPFWPRET